MTIPLSAVVSFFIGFGLGGLALWLIQKSKIKTLEDQTNLFESLSSKALQANNQNFLTLASENLKAFQMQAKGELDQKHQSIQSIVDPVKETLQKFEDQLRQLENKREGAYSGIQEQIKFLHESSQNLKTETTNLIQILKGSSQARGKWGENQLRRIVELAGMVKHCDFIEQATSNNGDIRPDMIVKLSGNRNIVLDAKVSLNGYLEAMETQDEAIRKQKLQVHAKHIRSHIQTLGKKSYFEYFKPSPDFVLLFLPTDEIYNAALMQDPELFDAGVKEKVIIATPTILITLLKLVAIGWRDAEIEKNAMVISTMGKDLYERISKMGSHFSSLGKKLGEAVGSYNDALGSLESRVLPAARKFQDLQHSETQSIPKIEPIEQNPRELQAEELKTVRLLKD
jgi:DNA recombination protein RmuC